METLQSMFGQMNGSGAIEVLGPMTHDRAQKLFELYTKKTETIRDLVAYRVCPLLSQRYKNEKDLNY